MLDCFNDNLKLMWTFQTLLNWYLKTSKVNYVLYDVKYIVELHMSIFKKKMNQQNRIEDICLISKTQNSSL